MLAKTKIFTLPGNVRIFYSEIRESWIKSEQKPGEEKPTWTKLSEAEAEMLSKQADGKY